MYAQPLLSHQTAALTRLQEEAAALLVPVRRRLRILSVDTWGLARERRIAVARAHSRSERWRIIKRLRGVQVVLKCILALRPRVRARACEHKANTSLQLTAVPVVR